MMFRHQYREIKFHPWSKQQFIKAEQYPTLIQKRVHRYVVVRNGFDPRGLIRICLVTHLVLGFALLLISVFFCWQQLWLTHEDLQIWVHPETPPWGQTAASNRTVTSSSCVWHHGRRGFRWSQREVGSDNQCLNHKHDVNTELQVFFWFSWRTSRTRSPGSWWSQEASPDWSAYLSMSGLIGQWVRQEFLETAGPESGLWEEPPVSEEGRSRGRESYP